MSVLAGVTAVNYLFLGGRNTAGFMFFGVMGCVLIGGGIFWSARRLSNRSVAIVAPDAERLEKLFRPFSEGVSFRQIDGEDARAIDLKSPLCVIGSQYLESLVSEDKDRDTSKARFVVAHELSHLLSGDMKSFMVAAIGVSMVLGVGFGCFLAMLRADLTFDIRTIAGFGYLAFAYAAIIYWVIRVREFYADKIAGLIIGEEVGHKVLAKAARAAKYIRYPFWYFVTHPSPADRLRHYDEFSGIYEYSVTKLLACAFALSCSIILIPISTLSFEAAFTKTTIGLGSLVALLPMAAILLLGIFIQFHIVFHLVVPATIGEKESFVSITLKCLVLIACALINLEIISLLIFRREIVSYAMDKVIVDNLVVGCANLLVTHWVYFFMARQFRANGGDVVRPRLQRSWQWCGAIIATVLVLVTYAASKRLFSLPADATGVDEISALITISVVSAFIIGLTYLAWRRAVRKNAKRIFEIKRASVADQIVPGQRYMIGVELLREPFLFRLGCYVAFYIAGLYFVLQVAAINDPDPQPLGEVSAEFPPEWVITMRSSRDGAYFLAWTFFIFPIQLLVLKIKGGLFPARRVITVADRE